MPEHSFDPLPGGLEKLLQETLKSGEAIHVKLRGAFKEALVCTDTRVMILKSGFMTGQLFGNNIFQLPYANIAGTEVKFGVFSGGFFELSAGGMQNSPKSYWSQSAASDPKKAPNCVSITERKQAQRFREACSFILEKASEARAARAVPSQSDTGSREDILSALEKLGQLRDSGILSSEEFELKKKDLLSRL